MNEAAALPAQFHRRARRVVLLLCALPLAYSVVRAATERYALGRALGLAHDTGWLALGLLSASLATSPVARWLRSRADTADVASWLAALRRSLGIGCGLCALVHAALAFVVLLHARAQLLWSWPHLRAGECALLIVLGLTLTSFSTVVRALRLRHWKELHRLAYAALGFATLHVLQSSFASVAVALACVGGASMLLAVRVLRRGAD